MKKVSKCIINACVLLLSFQTQAQQFVHPGLLQSREDLMRMRNGIAAQTRPLLMGYIELKNNPQSRFDYKMQGPMAMVGRNPTVGQGVYDADASAAYQNALMWTVTADRRYADKAKEIVDAWCSTLKSITGRDAVLMAGLGPFKMVNAAEIMRYTDPSWTAAEVRQAEQHFKDVIYPVIRNFAPFANGNWDSAALKTMIAIAVFCNDRPMFERAMVYYQYGSGDGSLGNYIINDTGQCQESGRDQAHTQLGIAHLADCAEIAWHQGLDLYSLLNDRLLKGFEYTAKYNLGEDVPYVPAMDRTGKYLHPHIAAEGRGNLRAMYEEVYNHYVNRVGRIAPYNQKAAEKIRPERQGLPAADHIGFGTFLYSRSRQVKDLAADSVPPVPAGLMAIPGNRSIRLTWVPVRGASFYQVKRQASGNGQYAIISKNITGAEFHDSKVSPGRVYSYSVFAVNKYGKSDDAYPAAAIAGLPGRWAVTDLHAGTLKGKALSEGSGFRVEGTGMGLRNSAEDATFVHHQTVPGKALVIRYQPQLTSQFTGFGITLRAGSAEKSAGVNLLIAPQAEQNIEAPKWVVSCTVRNHAGDSLKTAGSLLTISEPVVTFGRMTGSCWLKLVQKKDTVSSFFSADGKNWVQVSSITQRRPLKEAGIIVYSGIKGISTTVKLDHVQLK